MRFIMAPNELASLIFKKHGVKVGIDDPIMVMVTICQAMMNDERQAYKESLAVIEQQSKSQLSIDSIKRLSALISKKTKPNYAAYLFGAGTAALVALVMVLTVKLWYEPAKIGARFMDAYSKMDKQTQDAVKKAMQ